MNTLQPRVYHGKKQDSLNARAVAKDVINTIREGKKVVLKDIALKHGYSESSANQHAPMQTRAYKEELSKAVASMEGIREKILSALNDKDMSKEKMFDLTKLLQTVNHDIQLLSGKSTENVSHKSNVIVFGSNDFLQMQIENKKLLDNKARE